MYLFDKFMMEKNVPKYALFILMYFIKGSASDSSPEPKSFYLKENL